MLARDDPGAVAAHVRSRLRRLRTEQGLTLQEVADRASLDVSTLSRLEAGKRRLALDHLPALAGALNVSIDALLRTSAPEDPVVRGAPERVGGLTMWPLSRRGPAAGLQAYKVHIAAEYRTPPAELPTHEGHAWLYVLSGRLRLLLGGDDHVVQAGEAAEFDTWTPHWFGAADGPVELIGLFGPSGERIHVVEQATP